MECWIISSLHRGTLVCANHVRLECGTDEKEIAYKISVRLLEGRDSSGDQRTVGRIVEDSITQAFIEEIGRESVDWNHAI